MRSYFALTISALKNLSKLFMQDRYFPLIGAALFFLVFIIGLLFHDNSLFFNILISIGFLGFLISIGSYYFFEYKSPISRERAAKSKNKISANIEPQSKYSKFLQGKTQRKIIDMCDMDGCQNVGYYYPCTYCGKFFCENHRLPDQHNCENIQKWRDKYPPAVSIDYTQSGKIFTNDSRDFNRKS